MIKCKWGKSLFSKMTTIIPLPFELQMVRAYTPDEPLSSHLQWKFYGDNSAIPWHVGNCVTSTNTVGWGNKLVTVFANLTLTEYKTLKPSNYLKTISLYRDRTIAARTLMAKTAPYPSCPPGLFPTLLPGPSAGWASPGNVYSLNRRAVSFNKCRSAKHIISFDSVSL